MESAERDRMTVKRTILTIQGFAQNLQLWAGLKKSISALTDIASVFICNNLQNSSKTRNTEKSCLLLLVHGVGCKLTAVQFGDSQKTNLYHSGSEDVA
jgi:hypothetical protein